jgi:hypothetical protein
MDAWYINLSSRAKWSGNVSDPFPIQQVVGQADVQFDSVLGTDHLT